MAACTRAGSSTGLSLPKWQIALAVGAPVALGLGIWYYRSQKKKVSKDVKPDSPTPTPTVSSEQDKIAAVASANSLASEPVSDVPDSIKEVPSAPLDPYKESQLFKNKGNKHFKEGKFADAIKCYQQAIDLCPRTKVQDISTFHQNRAAAYEQLVTSYYLQKLRSADSSSFFGRKTMMLLSRTAQKLCITIQSTRKRYTEELRPMKSPNSLKIVWKTSQQSVFWKLSKISLPC